MPYAIEERVRGLETWRAGVNVELEHMKQAVTQVGETFSAHVKHDSDARAELWRYNRRFTWYMLGLVLAAVVGPYLRQLIPQIGG